MLKLNETPVRTSRNFNINNIKLEDVNVPETIKPFNGYSLTNIPLNENVSDINLTYGVGDLLIDKVKEQSNFKIYIDCKQGPKEKQIDFKFDKNNISLLENIEIVADENVKSTVILKYETENDAQYFHNGVLRINAKKNSEINIIVANLMNIESNNFMSIETNIEENAKVKFVCVDFGGKNSVTNYYSNIKGDYADNSIYSIYIGKENQVFDLNYIGELRGEKSNIKMEVQGALKDDSKKNFKGTIDFKKGCKKAKGSENENCMLLSDNAKSIALPMLLCSEEDVEGEHSTSAGKVGEKELFYLMSRGFELKAAMKLMVRAKFNGILENIENENLNAMILEEIDKRLD